MNKINQQDSYNVPREFIDDPNHYFVSNLKKYSSNNRSNESSPNKGMNKHLNNKDIIDQSQNSDNQDKNNIKSQLGVAQNTVKDLNNQ